MHLMKTPKINMHIALHNIVIITRIHVEEIFDMLQDSDRLRVLKLEVLNLKLNIGAILDNLECLS
jgi:hypothetical protein